MIPHIKSSLSEARSALDAFASNEASMEAVALAAELLIRTFEMGGRVYSCGNGGSMCDAMHFAEELTGRFRGDRPGIAAMAINDVSHITCVANDYGYDQIFSRFVSAHGKPNDVLLAISTSGRSQSIIRAAKTAKAIGMKIIGLTGRNGSPMNELCDICICAPAGRYADRVQEMHIKIIHILIELIERRLCPDNYE